MAVLFSIVISGGHDAGLHHHALVVGVEGLTDVAFVVHLLDALLMALTFPAAYTDDLVLSALGVRCALLHDRRWRRIQFGQLCDAWGQRL